MQTLMSILSLATLIVYFRDNSTIKLKGPYQSLVCDLDVELKPALAAAGTRVSRF